jgi:predicted hotdog family 3-hydroxylacyl-ACP dehydratase
MSTAGIPVRPAIPDVRLLLPHSGQMVLLERVLSVDEESLCAEVRLGPTSMLAGAQGVGAWVGIEYMAQAIAAHAGWLAQQRGEPVKVGVLLGARKYASTLSSFPLHCILKVYVQRILMADNGLGAFDCRIDIDGGAAGVATALVTVFQPLDFNQFLESGNTV